MEFVCSAGRIWSEITGWHIWDSKKQEWVNEIPTVKAEVVGLNEFSDEAYEEMKNATEQR